MTKDFLAMSFEQQLQRHINDTENNKRDVVAAYQVI